MRITINNELDDFGVSGNNNISSSQFKNYIKSINSTDNYKVDKKIDLVSSDRVTYLKNKILNGIKENI